MGYATTTVDTGDEAKTMLLRAERLLRRSHSLTLVAVILSILSLSLTTAIYHPIIIHGNQYDDSYITYRYAVNLAEGRGLTFNSYERVNSASSFLYTLLLATIYKMGFHNLERAGVAIGLISEVTLIFLTVFLTHQLAQSPLLTVGFVLPLCLCGSVAGWAVSGMETILYSALIVGFLTAYAARKTFLMVFLLSLCLLCRPEGIVLLCAAAGAEAIASRFTISKMLLAILGTGLVVFGGYMLFNLLYYGSLLPHPLALKTIAIYYWQGVGENIVTIGTFFVKNFGVYLVLGGALFVETTRRALPGICRSVRYKSQILFKPTSQQIQAQQGECGDHTMQLRAVDFLIALFIGISFLSFVFGPKSDLRRYTVHIVPVLAIATVVFLKKLNALMVSQRRYAWLLLTLFVLANGQALQNQQRTARKFLKGTEDQKARKALGVWIHENVPLSDLIISSDIGAIAYFAKGHDFVDAFGLTTQLPVIEARQNSWESFVEWLEKKKPAWVADSASTSTGETTAFRIITRPWEFYYGIGRRDEPYLDVGLDVRIRNVLEIPVNGREYIVAKLDWLRPKSDKE